MADLRDPWGKWRRQRKEPWIVNAEMPVNKYTRVKKKRGSGLYPQARGKPLEGFKMESDGVLICFMGRSLWAGE